MFKKAYNNLKTTAQAFSPALYAHLDKRKIILKFLIAGGTTTVVDLALLYFFTGILGVHYLTSSFLAFCVAIFVSFSLQKYWTFRDKNEKVKSQLFFYFLTGITNLFLNTLFMYILVDHLGLMYILAQIITSGVIAVGNFLVYRFIIFKKIDQPA